jgi:hypothetical protein
MAYHQVFFTGKRGNKIDFNCFVFGSYFRSLLRADAVIYLFISSKKEEEYFGEKLNVDHR